MFLRNKKLVLVLLLAAVVFALPQPASAQLPEDVNCRPLTARRHEAWDSVFFHFPERIDLSVDGYIATTCNEIGRTAYLHLNGHLFLVKVADCQNRSAPPGTDEPFDIDYRLWFYADAPNAPTPAKVCFLP